jgi:hypothetical protein
MNPNERRLTELQGKERLNDAEMNELILLSPAGTFKSLPNALDIGIVDLEKSWTNYIEGASRSQHAYASGCYIEVISLRLQHLDYWLRNYWVSRNKKGKIFDPDDKRTFGAILSDCEKLGFEKSLVDRMKLFNASRVDAIHKYLLGAIHYDELKVACDEHKGLDAEVAKYVRDQVGVVIKNR